MIIKVLDIKNRKIVLSSVVKIFWLSKIINLVKNIEVYLKIELVMICLVGDICMDVVVFFKILIIIYKNVYGMGLPVSRINVVYLDSEIL